MSSPTRSETPEIRRQVIHEIALHQAEYFDKLHVEVLRNDCGVLIRVFGHPKEFEDPNVLEEPFSKTSYWEDQTKLDVLAIRDASRSIGLYFTAWLDDDRIMLYPTGAVYYPTDEQAAPEESTYEGFTAEVPSADPFAQFSSAEITALHEAASRTTGSVTTGSRQQPKPSRSCFGNALAKLCYPKS